MWKNVLVENDKYKSMFGVAYPNPLPIYQVMRSDKCACWFIYDNVQEKILDGFYFFDENEANEQCNTLMMSFVKEMNTP